MPAAARDYAHQACFICSYVAFCGIGRLGAFFKVSSKFMRWVSKHHGAALDWRHGW